MIRAVTYIRSSKDRADASPAAQRRALEELARTRGMLLVGEYVDAVESGKDADRPAFQCLLHDLRAPGRTWDHILTLDTSRIARRRAIAILFEEHECRPRGVRVIYKSLPEGDPITEMLLKSVLQAMDEWHSLTSKVKGLAGMAENVRNGWRSGGRAPKGYQLEHQETATVRDGAPVTKSRLVPSPDAGQVRAYLGHRAAGVRRRRAAELAGACWPPTTLLEMERNALTYAGHTVWNRTAERVGGRYQGGAKWRPRSEWVICRDTHEPLISEDTADRILTQLESRKRGGGAPARRTYMLAGLLVDPQGASWHGDSGAYRLGKGPRIEADRVERAIIGALLKELRRDALAEAIARHYRRLAEANREAPEETGTIRRRVAELDRKIARLADLTTETSAPEALLRRIEAMEEERAEWAASLEEMEAERQIHSALRAATPAEVKHMLCELAAHLDQADPRRLRDAVSQLVEQIELDPETSNAVVVYRVAPAKTGEQLASPRGVEPLSPP